MLVLSRRLNEAIIIGDDIEITLVEVRGRAGNAVVRLGIKAPPGVKVLHKEIVSEVATAMRQAAQNTAIPDQVWEPTES